eukprot:365708-Chlamydomonas_euryale.AAC.4
MSGFVRHKDSTTSSPVQDQRTTSRRSTGTSGKEPQDNHTGDITREDQTAAAGDYPSPSMGAPLLSTYTVDRYVPSMPQRCRPPLLPPPPPPGRSSDAPSTLACAADASDGSSAS